jgi:ATP-dependent Zn protease
VVIELLSFSSSRLDVGMGGRAAEEILMGKEKLVWFLKISSFLSSAFVILDLMYGWLILY